MAMGPVLAFGRSAASKIARSMVIPAAAALLVVIVVWISGVRSVWALLCAGIAALGTFAVIVSFLRSVSARRRSTGESIIIAALRLIDRDHRRYGGQFAHLGVMMIVLGVAGSSLFASKHTFQLHPGDSAELDGRTLVFRDLQFVREVNYDAARATLILTGPDGEITTLRPEKRLYDKWQREFNSEVDLRSTLREDIYVILAGWENRGETTAIQVLLNPMVLWIWLGGIVLCAGGVFSLLPRLLPRAVPSVAVQPATGGPRGTAPSGSSVSVNPETAT
jgi:cytochrome c-type biogenesis protein CcmF